MMGWACPNCGEPLADHDNMLRCENGHSFDRAKQGYVNLLLANQKHSRDPGDNGPMIEARRQFLNEGHYDPLIQVIAECVNDNKKVSEGEFRTFLDLGCGEGYYLHQLQKHPPFADKDTKFFGVDISKFAVRKSATLLKNESADFAVASSYHIPLMSQSMDGILSVFAPFAEKEVLRCLTHSGIFVRVSPGEKHLLQLKEKLYDNVKLHSTPKIPEGFQLIDQRQIQLDLELRQKSSIGSLLEMTPLNWHGSKEAKAALLEAEYLDVSADFIVQVLEKNPLSESPRND